VGKELEKGLYWNKLLTGNPETVPADIRQKVGAQDESLPAEARNYRLMNSINRSWVVDHRQLNREQVRSSWPELRQDIEGDCIVQYDHCDIGHTVALPDHTFCNCHTKTQMSLDDYLVYAKEQQEEAKLHPGFVNQEEPEIGMIFASCVPWVAFTQCIQPVPIPADCNPRIVFGKFIKEGDRTLMPLHIQCNHALVDGYHLGLFYQEFEKIAASV
jgi:chloramphenicol O-acetyltransferase